MKLNPELEVVIKRLRLRIKDHTIKNWWKERCVLALVDDIEKILDEVLKDYGK